MRLYVHFDVSYLAYFNVRLLSPVFIGERGEIVAKNAFWHLFFSWLMSQGATPAELGFQRALLLLLSLFVIFLSHVIMNLDVAVSVF